MNADQNALALAAFERLADRFIPAHVAAQQAADYALVHAALTRPVLTDAMVEAAARDLFNDGHPDEDDPNDPDQLSWSSMAEDDTSRADLYRDDARRILGAAFGSQS